jgi:hypothetical protein
MAIHRIEFIRDDAASRGLLRTVTDISISPETTKRRALALWPEMRRKGATTFLIRNADGAEIYRWKSQARFIGKMVHEMGGRARAYGMLRTRKLKL